MRILVLGRGAREGAIAAHLGRHGHGVLRVADARAAASVVDVDLVVIGPEALIAEDAGAPWKARGVPVLAPDPAAARLETSKAFARSFAARHRLPMAPGAIVHPDAPVPSLGGVGGVVKLDGLAAGKGTWVCADRAAVEDAVRCARALRPDAPVIVEERLHGQELSLMALCDGERAVAFPVARDAKRRFDGDGGPNTGGMGAWAPVPVAATVAEEGAALLARALAGARAEGMPFRGVLYAGLMATADGLRLLEFNVRFGDPEAQAVLPLVDEDLAPWFLGAASGRLPGTALRLRRGSTCSVVVASADYPDPGPAVRLTAVPRPAPDRYVDGILGTDGGGVAEGGCPSAPGSLRGGRLFTVTALAPTLSAARLRAYHAVREVRGVRLSWRTDIGAA